MIRILDQSDREAFLALAREFYASPAVLHNVPDEYHERAFEELMRAGAYLSGYMIECDGEAVGYALTARTYSHEAGGAVLWLEELYIRPRFRSRGLGREFFCYVTDAHPDVRRFRLEVEPDNERAINLYERLGYRRLPYLQMIRDAQS